jgi:ribosome-binding protein aMBF1 (putative translation factor)
MATRFEDFIGDLEKEAAAEGPIAEAELDALRVRFQLAREFLQARQQHRFSQKRLAELTGIAQSEISKIESGRANPTVATVSVLARALDSEIHLVERDGAGSFAL